MKNKDNTDLNQRQDMKYKFIPPSKLMNAKIHARSNKQNHFHSLADIQDAKKLAVHMQPESVAKMQQNKQNQGLIGKKAFQIVRSLSNPKLTSSNSRNAILKQKNPPLQNISKDSIEIERSVHEHLDEARVKQQFLKDEIWSLSEDNKRLKEQNECVRQENKHLHEKLGRLDCLIVLKNKQISSLHGKARQLQAQAKQKSQQNILITQSLKKVIDSQSIKIHQLSIKTEKNRNRLDEYFPLTVAIGDRYPLDNEDTARCKLKSNSFSSSRSNIESLLYEEDIPKTRVFLHMKENIDEEDGELFDDAQNSENLGMQNMIGGERPQFTTPSFGTVQESLVKQKKIEKQRNNDYFPSEAQQNQQNMSLSRISESVEQDNETERQQNRSQTKSQSTHQQLLDEIDQYLSKRTKFLSK